MSVVGRPCYAYHESRWICGVIIKHDQKNNQCTIKTETLGKIVVPTYKIRLADKEE